MSAEDMQVPLDFALFLAPECRAFVVLYKDPLRERIDVRPTRVLGLDEDVLFLAQTEPPVPHSLVGAEVEVAVLATDSDGAMRPVGYAARLLDLRVDYPTGHEGPDGDLTAPALAFGAPRPSDFFETSLRMHYRVPVDEDMGVAMRLEGFDVPELLDFSAGGARVRVARGEDGFPSLATGQSIPFRLLFLGSGYAAGEGIVRSLTFSEDGGSATFGLFFTNMEIRDIRYLERMVARTVSACRQRERDAEYV